MIGAARGGRGVIDAAAGRPVDGKKGARCYVARPMQSHPSPRLLLVAAALAATLLGAAARPAHAGYCDPEGAADLVKDVERYAKAGGAQPALDDICVWAAFDEAKLKKRLYAACEKIVAREAYDPCLRWAADAGKETMGGKDVFAELSKTHAVDPFDAEMTGAYNVGIYARLGDARATAMVMAAWQAAAGDKRTRGRQTGHLWKVFRNNAITLFEKVGGQTERDFLAAQLAAKGSDKAMKRRIEKAIATIDKRLAKQP